MAPNCIFKDNSVIIWNYYVSLVLFSTEIQFSTILVLTKITINLIVYKLCQILKNDYMAVTRKLVDLMQLL